MKLYEVPRNTRIVWKDEILHFHHIDGAYSYCTIGDKDGRAVHLSASADVEIYYNQKEEDENEDGHSVGSTNT